MTTYYVSSGIGDDGNAGTSTTAPLATLQAAANLVKPGDTVEVMNGTYTGPAGGVVVNITTSGTAAAPITFEAMPGQTPVIDSSGCWQGININANNIVINGFTVVGDEKNFTQAQATAGYSSGNASLDGSGIVVNGDGTHVPNHIIIENNTAYNEPGAGISVVHADYVTILNNVVHDTSNWSAFGSSGISIWESMNSDTNPGVHMTISGNTVYDNAQLVPTLGGNIIYDGEGIILDTNPNFVGQMLVENNTVHGNGSSGIESFQTDNAVITGNTVYGNDIDNVQAASNAEIFINSSTNDAVTNNTFAPTGTTPPPGSDPTPPAAPVISGDTVSDNIVMLTGTAQAGSIITVFDNSKELGIAPTNSSGAWTFTTGILPYGNQSFTATTTDVAGNVSPLSSALAVSLEVPLVVNGSFTTGNFSGWTLGGNEGSTQWGPQIFIDTNSEGATPYAAGMGSIGADGTLSQTIATTAGQTYTLSFWLQNEASGTNDFKAIWNGQTLLSLTNAAQSGYTQYTYNVTATGSTTTLEFSAANGSSQWDLDNVSLTPAGSTTTTPPAGSTTTPPPAAPIIKTGVANSDGSVTLTGTAPDGSTVMVSDGGATALGTATANSTGAWSYKTAALAAASYAFTATDTTPAGTSAVSSPLDVTVTSSPPPGPTLSSIVESPASGDLDAGKTVTLTLKLNEPVTVTGGTPTLTLNDGGTATYGGGSGTNALTFSYTVAAGQNTSALAATAVNLNSATIEDGAGNAANLSLTGLTQSGPQIDTTTSSGASGSTSTGDPVAAGNLVVNGNFATGSFSGWTLGGNYTSTTYGHEIFIDGQAEQGNYAAEMGSVGSDGSISQTISTTAGQEYQLTFWLANDLNGVGATSNDFTAKWNGTSLLSLTNAPQEGYSEYTYNVVASSSTTTLEFDARQDPSSWSLDNISVTPVGTTSSGASGSTSTGSSGATPTAPTDTTLPAAPVISGDPVTAGNLVVNGNFATGSFSGWTLGGNYTSTTYGHEIFIDGQAEQGNYAAEMGSVGSDGSISQTISTTAGQEYQLTFWLANDLNGAGATSNDFTAKWNGTSLLSLTNAPQEGYTEYTYNVVASSSTTTLEFDARQDPSSWSLDNISLTASGTSPAPTNSLAGSSGSTTIATGATVEIAAADTASVTFQGSTGTLLLDQPSTFSGKIFGFSGNGSLSGSDHIDLINIKYDSVHDSYANGVLTVTDDRGDTAKLSFNGSYTLANFKFASDGSGGTVVYDPPVTPSSGQNTAAPGPIVPSAGKTLDPTDLPGIAFNVQSTLGYLPNSNQAAIPSLAEGIHNANIALLGNYMASSFAVASHNHGTATTLAEVAHSTDQSVLSSPHHA